MIELILADLVTPGPNPKPIRLLAYACFDSEVAVLVEPETCVAAVLIADARDVFVAEDMLNGSGGDFVQFNFGRPANVSGFIAENKALWKPFYEKNMTKLNMGGWGVARRLTTGNDSDSPTIMSWDAFKTMNDLMKYRIGFALPKEMTDKSKMSQYMPNGFSSQPIFSFVKYTKDAGK